MRRITGDVEITQEHYGALEAEFVDRSVRNQLLQTKSDQLQL